MKNFSITNVKEAILLLSEFLAESEQRREEENIDSLDSTSQDFWRLKKGSLITIKNKCQNIDNTFTPSKTVTLTPINNKPKNNAAEVKKSKYGQGSISTRTQVRKSGKVYQYYSITVYDGVKNHVKSAKTFEKAQERLAELNKELGIKKR